MPFVPAAPWFSVDTENPLSPASALSFLGSVGGQIAGEAAWSIPALTAAVRRGEEAAVGVLYARYRERLTRYCLVVTRGDEAVADEAVQGAFLKAVRSLRKLDDERALWAWLARAARCTVSDAGRSRRRYAAVLDKFAALFAGPSQAPEDTEFVWLQALQAAMDALDSDDRLLLEARYFQRRTLSEVALEQGTTDRAIESRLARSREKLRQSILQQLASQAHES